jgi:hypothetical protein
VSFGTLFPADTYFQNTIDKVSVSNTQHQWVYDSLAAAANNKQIQGDDAPTRPSPPRPA